MLDKFIFQLVIVVRCTSPLNEFKTKKNRLERAWVRVVGVGHELSVIKLKLNHNFFVMLLTSFQRISRRIVSTFHYYHVACLTSIFRIDLVWLFDQNCPGEGGMKKEVFVQRGEGKLRASDPQYRYPKGLLIVTKRIENVQQKCSKSSFRVYVLGRGWLIVVRKFTFSFF